MQLFNRPCGVEHEKALGLDRSKLQVFGTHPQMKLRGLALEPIGLLAGRLAPSNRNLWVHVEQNGSARPYTLSDRRNVPSSTFLHTPYSRVGLNEREAKAAGLDYVVKRLPVATVPKAQVMRRPEGMMKALVENGTDRILGAMLLAAESHEVINIVKLAMDMGAPASTLRDMMFTHPTMAEALNDLFA